jgi:hypothetical protein
MAVDAGPGPEREAVNLPKWEADAFLLLVEASTYAELRYQLSYAMRMISRPLPVSVIDAYQGNARRMWRPNPSAGTAP